MGASQDESTYIISSYLISNAIILPISGWLSNVLGRKRFYMICVAIFTASSVLCGTATSLGMIIVFRVLQGIGGGGLAPTEQSIFADSFTPKQRAMAFALYGFTVVTAPAVGPVLGGWLTDHYSWHWVFLINLPVGLISLLLVWFFVYDSPLLIRERAERLRRGFKVDYVGFALVAIGFGSLQVVLDRFAREDGFSTPWVTALAVVAALALGALVVWELRHEQPVVNLRLLRSAPFAISNVILFIFGFIIVATTQLLPQFSQELLGYDALTAGMTLAMGGVVSLFMMPISGIVTGRLIQPKWLVMLSLGGVAYAMWYSSGLDLDAGFWTLSRARMLQVVWMPLLFIPLSAVQFIGVPPNKSPEASALVNLMRNLGGSVGIAAVTTELQWRSQFHHARLAEHITPYNGWGWNSALAQIAQRVQTQATMLSYVDVFTILTVVALAAAPLVLFLPNIPKGAPVGGH